MKSRTAARDQLRDPTLTAPEPLCDLRHSGRNAAGSRLAWVETVPCGERLTAWFMLDDDAPSPYADPLADTELTDSEDLDRRPLVVRLAGRPGADERAVGWETDTCWMPDKVASVEYLDRLDAILQALDPFLEPASDGISIRPTQLVPMDEGPWPEVEIRWTLTLPDHPALADVARTGAFRLPFGRDWLALSMYDDPAEFASLVKMNLHRAARNALRPTRPSASAPDPKSEEVSQYWSELIDDLRSWGEVSEVEAGRIEVAPDNESGRDEGVVVTFIITPQQWAALRQAGRAEYGIDEAVGVLDDDVRFVLYRDGGFVKSIREELPPVRGTATLRRVAAVREANPGVEAGWFAFTPPSKDKA